VGPPLVDTFVTSARTAGGLLGLLGLLTAVAVERHGQTALVRALSRPQRAPASVSAF
jgi:hypothetical protein